MLFFTPELIKEFTKDTNEYAKEQIKQNHATEGKFSLERLGRSDR
jgi:hypothetical protein